MNAFGVTDIGVTRLHNEDSIFVCVKPIGCLPNLFIVSDGMGGHNAGEVASSKAIEFFCEYVSQGGRTQGKVLEVIVEGVRYANKKVYDLSRQDYTLRGMGATFTACVTTGGKLNIAHIGDSRVYFAANGRLSQLTEDHSYVNELVKMGEITEEEAQHHPQKNILTRALGVEDDEAVDGLAYDANEDGVALLCSDGLTNMLSNIQILQILSEPGSLEDRGRKLIQMANNYGGLDNISAILVDVKR
ncbi:MAG: Stp1/IreP family PP2C-type Ser/Thr phosphatase [Clostridiales bacterium]|jgi:protein phosphatase|nr:Stp1/IreP family PP2C-type Ser/Thr phosphatase [Clostridiales bacterium]